MRKIIKSERLKIKKKMEFLKTEKNPEIIFKLSSVLAVKIILYAIKIYST